MKYEMRKKSVMDAVSVILQDCVGMEQTAAAQWARRIDSEAERICGMVSAVEARCRRECSAAADPTGYLQMELLRYTLHIDTQGDPMDKPHRTMKEEAFCTQLEQARSLFGEGCGERIAKSVKASLLTELSIRNALYDALAGGHLDVDEPCRADDMARRNCAYTIAVWMRNNALGEDTVNSEKDTLSTLALKAAILDRLGYLNQSSIAKLHAAIQRRLDNMV